MKKNSLIFLLILMILGAGIGKYLGDFEISKRMEMKRHPMKFTYFKNDSGVYNTVLSSDNKECMNEILNYYSLVSKSDIETIYLPPCFKTVINYKDTLYVLSLDQDSISALVAEFYKTHNGKEEYITGYVLRSTLHDRPYSKD